MSHLNLQPRKSFFLIVALCMFTATAGCRESSWPLWDSYSSRFIDHQTGRVFDPNGDQHTTSEAQAYALFFALVANDRPTFNRVLAWTETNLAGGDLANHLPAWLWGKDKDGQWKVLDPNSASDADTWIAYSLLEAGRLWRNSDDGIKGQALLALIAKNEVATLPGFGPMLLPAPAGFQHDGKFTLNPSYLPPFVFERLAAADPSGPWHQIARNIPRLLAQSARHGFAMDWLEFVPGDGFYPAAKPSAPPAAPKANVQPDPPVGSYDAIRVYLWAGMIPAGDKLRTSILNAVPSMGAYLTTHSTPPEKVSEQGIPGDQPGPVGFSAAVLPYLRANPKFAGAIGNQLVRLSTQRNASSGLYGKDVAYYDQCLALFATGFLDARFRFGPAGELQVEWNRE